MFLCAFPVLSDWINALHSYCCSWIFVNLLAIVNASSVQVLVDVFVAVQRSSMLLVTVRWYSTMVCVITCVVLCYWKLIGYARCSAKQSSRPCSTYGWRVCLFVLLSCLLVCVCACLHGCLLVCCSSCFVICVIAWWSVWLFVSLFVCLLVWVSLCVLGCVRLVIGLVVCLFVCLLVCVFDCLIVGLCVRLLFVNCSCLCLLACASAYLFVCVYVSRAVNGRVT